MKLIKFEKDGCMLCKRLDSILKDMGVLYESINLSEDKNLEYIDKYGITSTPTLIKIEGKGISKLEGAMTAKGIESFCEMSGASMEDFENFHCENGACGV